MRFYCLRRSSRSAGPDCQRLMRPRWQFSMTAPFTPRLRSPISAQTKWPHTKGSFEMFTGIITDGGEVLNVDEDGRLNRLPVACRYDASSIETGASLAHAG